MVIRRILFIILCVLTIFINGGEMLLRYLAFPFYWIFTGKNLDTENIYTLKLWSVISRLI